MLVKGAMKWILKKMWIKCNSRQKTELSNHMIVLVFHFGMRREALAQGPTLTIKKKRIKSIMSEMNINLYY